MKPKGDYIEIFEQILNKKNFSFINAISSFQEVKNINVNKKFNLSEEKIKYKLYYYSFYYYKLIFSKLNIKDNNINNISGKRIKRLIFNCFEEISKKFDEENDIIIVKNKNNKNYYLNQEEPIKKDFKTEKTQDDYNKDYNLNNNKKQGIIYDFESPLIDEYVKNEEKKRFGKSSLARKEENFFLNLLYNNFE